MTLNPIRMLTLMAPLFLSSLNTRCTHQSSEPNNLSHDNSTLALQFSDNLAHSPDAQEHALSPQSRHHALVPVKKNKRKERNAQQESPENHSITNLAAPAGIGLCAGIMLGVPLGLTTYSFHHNYNIMLTEVSPVLGTAACVWHRLRQENVPGAALSVPTTILSTIAAGIIAYKSVDPQFPLLHRLICRR